MENDYSSTRCSNYGPQPQRDDFRRSISLLLLDEEAMMEYKRFETAIIIVGDLKFSCSTKAADSQHPLFIVIFFQSSMDWKPYLPVITYRTLVRVKMLMVDASISLLWIT